MSTVARSLHRTGLGNTLSLLTAAVLLLTLAVGPASAVVPHDANVTVYRVSDATFESAGVIEATIANGTLEPANELVVGDTLVVAIDSRRLAETMVGGDGSTTERFFDALAGDAEFRVIETTPDTNANRKVASLGRENVTVHRSGTTTYALVETGALAFRYREVNRSARVHGDERFAVEFGYDLPHLSRGGYEPAGPVVGLHPFSAEFDTPGYWYVPLPPEWVALAVNVEIEPAAPAVARVTLEDGRTISAPVEPDDVPGLNRVWLDLRGVDPGTGYVLELVHDGEVVDRYNGTVREPRARLTNVTLAQVEGGAAIDVIVSASHGGKVQVLDESCDVLGTKWVEPGVERRVTIELWGRSGQRIPFRPDVLVRVVRHRGASDALFRGHAARATIDFGGGTCPAPASPSTPTATPSPTDSNERSPSETPPLTTIPVTHAPDGQVTVPSGTRDGTGGTSGDGGSGFIASATLLVLCTLGLLGARSR